MHIKNRRVRRSPITLAGAERAATLCAVRDGGYAVSLYEVCIMCCARVRERKASALCTEPSTMSARRGKKYTHSLVGDHARRKKNETGQSYVVHGDKNTRRRAEKRKHAQRKEGCCVRQAQINTRREDSSTACPFSETSTAAILLVCPSFCQRLRRCPEPSSWPCSSP